MTACEKCQATGPTTSQADRTGLVRLLCLECRYQEARAIAAQAGRGEIYGEDGRLLCVITIPVADMPEMGDCRNCEKLEQRLEQLAEELAVSDAMLTSLRASHAVTSTRLRETQAGLHEALNQWSAYIVESFHERASCDFEEFRDDEQTRIVELRTLATKEPPR